MAWVELDDEGVGKAEALTGVSLTRRRWRWITRASVDAISHFTDGFGDDNSLWLDPEHRRQSPLGATAQTS